MCKRVNAHPALVYYPTRYTYYRTVSFYISNYDRTSSDTRICTYFNGTQYFCSSAYDYIIADCWVSLSVFFSCSTKSNSLIKKTPVSYFCCFANYYSHAMIYKYAIPDFGSRMYFNACEVST